VWTTSRWLTRRPLPGRLRWRNWRGYFHNSDAATE
jgi:hypothetical protein